MKRYVILTGIAALVVSLMLLRRGGHGGVQPRSDVAAASPAVTPPNEPKPRPEPAWVVADTGSVSGFKSVEAETLVRSYNQTANVPVAFYGQVVDQDTSPLQDVQVSIAVSEESMMPSLLTTGSTAILQRRTGPDGRFEVSGLNGHRVTVTGLVKEGYEPELGLSDMYGTYAPQSTEPVLFRMWATNLHQALIGGEKSFVVVPDGRHYAIDLLKGTIAEGNHGDLVAWIKRPEGVTWGQRYDWSCELTAPSGGLLESQSQAMFNAPEAGYTNTFTAQEDGGSRSWGFLTGDKHFYVRLRGGQIYGRIVINLYADYGGKEPGLIRIGYTVNPSGSRLLR